MYIFATSRELLWQATKKRESLFKHGIHLHGFPENCSYLFMKIKR